MSGKDELLDKAIVEAKEAEDWQLVEWLRAARGSESAARWYSGKLRDANRVKRKLLNENAKLRELVRDIYVDMWHCGEWLEPYEQRMQELGVEVSDA